MLEKLKQLIVLKNGNLNKNAAAILKNPKNVEIAEYVEIIEESFTFKSRSLSEKIFRILNNVIEPPKCKICQTGYLTFSVFKLGYVGTYCSVSCQMKDPECTKKRLLTIKEKNTPNKNLGSKRTLEQKQKMKEAANSRDKVEAEFKKRQTCMTKYGAPTIFQSKQFYTNRYQKRLNEIIEKLKIFNFEIIKTFENGRINLIKHKDCQTTFKISRLSANNIPTCPTCYSNPKTKLQNEICEWIKQFDDEIIIDSKQIIKPYQLDIFLPKKNIAFEFNGLYWHSTKKGIDPAYHFNKSFLCNENYIQLFHIFEDDWISKNEICKNRIKSLLDKSNRMFARNCTVKIIKTSKDFLEQHHIQGFIPAKINLGLFNNENLIAVMTFGKPRYDKSYEWELLRYCSNGNVIGGAGKLLAFFKKNLNPQSIITYRDKTWGFISSFYEKIGFTYLRTSKIGYSYYKEGQLLRISRIAFQEKNFNKNFDIQYNKNLSEEENAVAVKAYRVYDCGQDVYGWTYNVPPMAVP
jgi:hypothetical protein